MFLSLGGALYFEKEFLPGGTYPVFLAKELIVGTYETLRLRIPKWRFTS